MAPNGESNVHSTKLEAILANAVDAIITINDRGIIDSVNPATVSMFGYEQEELIGRNIKQLMPSPFRQEHDGYLKNYHRTGTAKIIGIGREVIGQRKDGSTFPMHLAVSELRLSGQRMYTGIIRDISDLKQAEDRLAQINEKLEERVRQRTAELQEAQAELVRQEKYSTLGKVSGGIAHEIRNPLNAVKMSAYYLVHAKDPPPEKVREHLERIDRQVNVIEQVVTALSDVAKLPEAKLTPTELRPLLESAVRSISMPDNISVEYSLEAELPPVRIDDQQIGIAIKNLIRNARDAMPNGGKLNLVVWADRDEVILEVGDEGAGISLENQRKIFEPLFTTKARGMGLGLSISKTITEKNRARLTFESIPGQGTRFRIHFQSGAIDD